jgi:uncharacterized protein YbjQ (UPF0145 family)
MRVTTLETVAGRMNEETLGVVRGSAFWSKRITKYNHGGLRGLQYTTVEDLAFALNDVKDQAEKQAKDQAANLGADAIVGLRLEVFELSEGMFTAVATGTAMRTSALPAATPKFAMAAANDDAFEAMSFVQKPTPRVGSSLMH